MPDDLLIKPLLRQEIPLLEQMNENWPYGRPLDLHRQRYAMQQAGDGVYLFAWHGPKPVGHVFLRWDSAPSYAPSRSERTAHISDLFVIPDYWSRGIGSRLMDTLEALAVERGYRQVGLSVAIDNTRARSIYAKRGYVNAGLGEPPARWTYIDPHGEEQV